MNPQPAFRNQAQNQPSGTRRFDRLKDVDWSFGDRTRQDELEALHPYPAKFIPEIPGTLLDKLPLEPGTAVLDPFVGSGTTLVEAQRRGINSVGIDVNSIACLISRVRTTTSATGFDDAVSEVIARASGKKSVAIPDIPNLDHWFKKPVAEVLAKLVGAIKKAPANCRDPLRLCLSSILVRVSNQDSDTRYAAVEKDITPENVFAYFENACARLSRAVAARHYKLSSATVLERDTLAVTAAEITQPIGAVITSPPYPNAYEYWLYHKYRMWWLGYDPLFVKEREIGARAHFFKAKHHTADDFIRQMRQTFALMAEVLRPEGYACFVVGRSQIHGEIIDNAKLIENVSAEFGFAPVFRAERVIRPNRKSFNLSHANIKTETVLVLAR
jgi:DNA modification methylase